MAGPKTLFDYCKMSDVRKRYGRTTHGGTTGKGHRKLERPLSKKGWIHLVLKSEKAVGPLSFLHPDNRGRVENLIHRKAKRFGVHIAELVNMGNHFHIRLRMADRELFQNFLRVITAQIARMVTGARRGKPFGTFWQGLAFTRLLKSGLELLQLGGYFEANRRQANCSYEERERFLEKFNRWIYRLRYKDA